MTTYTIIGTEYLVIDDVPLSTPAWVITDHAALWGAGDMRGEDIIIPGAAGVLPRQRRPTVTKVDLELWIVGHVDWNNVAQANERAGLARNVNHLMTNVAAQPGTPAGTRSAVLHMPPGSTPATLSGPVHVEQFRLAGRGPGAALAQLTLSIPAGALA
jgi:hypothetical protein